MSKDPKSTKQNPRKSSKTSTSPHSAQNPNRDLSQSKKPQPRSIPDLTIQTDKTQMPPPTTTGQGDELKSGAPSQAPSYNPLAETLAPSNDEAETTDESRQGASRLEPANKEPPLPGRNEPSSKNHRSHFAGGRRRKKD